MKIIKLTESDLQKIVKRVVNEQLVNDFKKIEGYLDSLGGKKSSTGDIIKYEFKNADGLGVVEVKKNGVTDVYILQNNVKKNIGSPKSLEELQALMSSVN